MACLKKIPCLKILVWLVFCSFPVFFSSHEQTGLGRLSFLHNRSNEESENGAWGAFQWWYAQRAQPYDFIPAGAFQKAVRYQRASMAKERTRFLPNGVTSSWASLGPSNVGGRILSLAVDPLHPNIVWAGSASGGLWKSTAGGGSWNYVNTGLPTLSVSSIVIDTAHSNIMYIGTGEISLYHRGLVGTTGARTSYGMGIVKSTDGGNTWTQTSLTWTFPQITAVEKIAINPRNASTLYAATSEGTFKSTDAGATWDNVDSVLMAMDVVIDPVDTATVYIACGSLNSSPNPGIYKTTDAGQTWTQLTNGLPSTDFGRTALALSTTNHLLLFAGISDAATNAMKGLYKTVDGGATWSLASSLNYVGSQGWYDNVVSVDPRNSDTVFCAGLDIYKSNNGGTTSTEISGNAVHVDHHAIAFDPTDPQIMYFGTDGGVYKSTDGGASFIDCNYSLLTTQFYPGFATAALDTSVALGGTQDNGTLRYYGSRDWQQVYGGDGGCCAIDPYDGREMYFESQYGDIAESFWLPWGWWSEPYSITNGLPPAGPQYWNFVSPFVIGPGVMYAGSKTVYKTTNGGDNWFAPNGGGSFNGTNVACIGVSRTDPDIVMAATGTGTLGDTSIFQVFMSNIGGLSWSNVTGSLPDRYPTDIVFDPTNNSTTYITYSGYGTPHLFRTTNLGQSWSDITSNLPDIPFQSIAIDSVEPGILYVGTDLGVFRSPDGGQSWQDFNAGMPLAMVSDLKISPLNSMLIASTYGNGVFQRKLYRDPKLTLLSPVGREYLVSGLTKNITWSAKYLSLVKLEFSADNGSDWTTIADNVAASPGSYSWSVPYILTTQGRIRISEAASGTPVDSSDTTFSIIVNPDMLGGWNLISIDRTVPDGRTNVVFPTAVSKAFAYSAGYVTRDSLVNGIGYWLKFGRPQFVTDIGDSTFYDSISVKKGWNIVGGISEPVAVSDVAQIPDSIVLTNYFGYRVGYVIADSLRPRHGYWVKVRSGGALAMASHQSVAKSVYGDRQQLSSLNTLTIKDNAGSEQTLYFGAGDKDINLEGYELPPLAPDGVFDVRFQSQRMVETIPATANKSFEFPISIQSAVYPVSVSWNAAAGARLSTVLKVGSDQFSMGNTGSISISNVQLSGISIILNSAPDRSVPQAFSLEQNYPNPFNPTTRIQYSVESKQHVGLRVYDLLGKEVATLVDGVQEAGGHTAEFNAGKLASGIYLYRLSAGTSSTVKKMVLLK